MPARRDTSIAPSRCRSWHQRRTEPPGPQLRHRGYAKNGIAAEEANIPVGEHAIHAAIEPLDGRRVHLRPAEPRDEAAFLAILTDPSVDQWWQSDDPAADANEKATQDDIAVWALEVGGAVVGLIQAEEQTDPQYRHASIDIVLASSAQDRGLGSDAVRTVARWLLDVRGHHRITIDPAASNVRAIRAYTRVGFRPVGLLRNYEGARDGTWHDGLLMDLLAGELLEP